jgi:acyl-CoA synthetase (AMP-forming)/AMP-acid ligase II
MNLMLLLEMASDAMGDRVAIGDRETGLSYGGVFDRTGRATTWLRDRGAERVLYTGVASPAHPIALAAASWAGVPFVPLNYRLADDRLRTMIERQAPAVLLCDATTTSRFEAIEGIDVVTTDEFLAALGGVEPAATDWSFDGDLPAVLLHTSGTSGDPKVAVLRQRHLVSYVLGSVEFMSAAEDEATLVSVPPYHIAGTAAILTSVYTGRRIVQLPSFEPAEWVRVVREQHVTHAMVVPTMLARIVDVLEASPGGLPSLQHLSYGGGRMPLPIVEKALELLPDTHFVNAYGLTETSSSIAVLGAEEHRAAIAGDDPAVRARLGSVGRPLPTVEITIRDEEGKEVPIGEAGEIWVRGEQVSGEYTSRSATDGEGWFMTNDAGRFDADGYLYVEGRLDDVIVRGGENISPGEIEDVLLSHDAVRDVAVLGVPDVEWGEAICAVVVVHDAAAVTADELNAWVTGRLRSSRALARVEFRTELPYNDTGKLVRRTLRESLAG